jgi:hypothetical protein
MIGNRCVEVVAVSRAVTAGPPGDGPLDGGVVVLEESRLGGAVELGSEALTSLAMQA